MNKTMFYETIGTRRTRTHRKVVLPKDKVLKERIGSMYHLSRQGVRYAQQELRASRTTTPVKPKSPRKSMWPKRVRKMIAELRNCHKYWVQRCKTRYKVRVNHLRARDYIMIRIWMRRYPGTYLQVDRNVSHVTWSDIYVTKGKRPRTKVICTAQRALEESLNSPAALTPLFIRYLYKRSRNTVA